MKALTHHSKLLAGLALALAGVLGWVVLKPSGTPPVSPATGMVAAAATKARVRAALEKLPLSFIENRGQLDERVAYYLEGRDSTVYFTAEGVTFAFTGAVRESTAEGRRALVRPVALNPTPAAEVARQRWDDHGEDEDEDDVDAAPGGDVGRQRWVLRLEFLGANRAVKPVGQDSTPAAVSYFKGRQDQWKTGVPTYASLVYRDLWPGIDLIYSGTAGRLKHTFLVRPGADPAQIRLAYRGATAVRLTEAGQLAVSAPVGGFTEDRPYVYQEVGGRQVEVAAAYALERPTAPGTHVYGFKLGAYDRSRPLVLDPVLLYAGYIGGADVDEAVGIALHANATGDAFVYLAGETSSTEATFPVTVGPDLTFNGVRDAFVAKVRADGTGLVWASYIGGSGDERGFGVAVDAAGNAYVTGFSKSSDATFPVLVGPGLTHNGRGDAFVAKVKADGTGLVYAGFIGGAGVDAGRAIAVDAAGNAYVTGWTSSTEATFPVRVGPDLTYNGGSFDAFVAKVKADGTGFVYVGYIGGAALEVGRGIAVDAAGNAYIAGRTQSTQATFPVVVGPRLTHGGKSDAFVAKVKADGTGLLYSGYIGGRGLDIAVSIALDAAGNAYVAGWTDSTQTTFPVTVGPDLTHNGEDDAFVAKVKADGSGFVYAGYIGGSGLDWGRGVAVDGAGNAYVTGWTGSKQDSFPVRVGPDLTHNGKADAFVAMVRADGTGLCYAGYIGGAGKEWGRAIAVDAAGNAYVTGRTKSSEATFPVLVGPDLTHNGQWDAFIAKISPGTCD